MLRETGQTGTVFGVYLSFPELRQASLSGHQEGKQGHFIEPEVRVSFSMTIQNFISG